MAHSLHIIQVASALILIALILIQRSSGDTGSNFGEHNAFQTRRGAERFLFVLTIILGIVFVAASLAVVIAG